MSHALHECVITFVLLGYEVLPEDYDWAPNDVLFPWPMVAMGYPLVILFSVALLAALLKYVMICGSVRS